MSPFPTVFKSLVLQKNENQGLFWKGLNLVPNNKFLDWFKLKALADNKINAIEKLKFVLGRTEYIKEGRKCWLPAFLLFP